MDRRDRTWKWYDSFSQKGMVATVEDAEGGELEVPCKFVVCDVCDGKGTHVNPSIDAHGISAEEFAEDPDFAVAYFDGMYDMQCNGCDGQRVVPEPSDDCPQELKDLVEERIRDHYEYEAECAAERRMGA